jgi:hypothetical protein
MSTINFSIYADTDFRQHWQTYMRNVNTHVTAQFTQYCKDVVLDARNAAPMSKGNPKKLYGKLSGELRRDIHAVPRGYLKVSFISSTKDPKTGIDYAYVRHEFEAKKYTTPGTHAHYLQQSFDAHSENLLAIIDYILQGGQSVAGRNNLVSIMSGFTRNQNKFVKQQEMDLDG